MYYSLFTYRAGEDDVTLDCIGGPPVSRTPQVPGSSASIRSQLTIRVYPDVALAEFRRWMHATYIPEKFPNYIETKVKKGDFLPGPARLLLGAVQRRVA